MTQQLGGNHSGTSTRATGLGLSNTALVYPQANELSIDDLTELNVCAFWKRGVRGDLGALAININV